MIHGGMWKCNDCGNVFDHPKVIYGHGIYTREDNDSPNEYYCPYCGSDDYTFADYCVECENVYPEDELEYGLCPDCLKKAAEEYAAEYVMNDREVRDDFAWWMHYKRKER